MSNADCWIAGSVPSTLLTIEADDEASNHCVNTSCQDDETRVVKESVQIHQRQQASLVGLRRPTYVTANNSGPDSQISVHLLKFDG